MKKVVSNILLVTLSVLISVVVVTLTTATPEKQVQESNFLQGDYLELDSVNKSYEINLNYENGQFNALILNDENEYLEAFQNSCQNVLDCMIRVSPQYKGQNPLYCKSETITTSYEGDFKYPNTFSYGVIDKNTTENVPAYAYIFIKYTSEEMIKQVTKLNFNLKFNCVYSLIVR